MHYYSLNESIYFQGNQAEWVLCVNFTINCGKVILIYPPTFCLTGSLPAEMKINVFTFIGYLWAVFNLN